MALAARRSIPTSGWRPCGCRHARIWYRPQLDSQHSHRQVPGWPIIALRNGLPAPVRLLRPERSRAARVPRRFGDSFQRPLPGFTLQGSYDIVCWTGGDLTPAARTAMPKYLVELKILPYRKYGVGLLLTISFTALNPLGLGLSR